MITFPPKKILVAYDLSDVSRTAWRHAAALAAGCGAALEAVYVEPRQMSADLLPPLGLTPARVRALRAKIRAAIGDGPKITILQGDAAACVLHMVRLHRPDLVVVGTHGRKGFSRAVLGSVAEAVIRSSPVPVLAARGRPREVRSILAPVNFTPYSKYGFDFAAAAAAALSARLTALHVSDDPIWGGNPRYQLSSLIHRLPPQLSKRCRPIAAEALGAAVPGILKSARGHEWIILVAHEKSLIGDAFFGTTLEQVLRRSSIPVLSVPAPARPFFAMKVAGNGSLSLK